MTMIKICGISREEDARAVNDALPDYAGFVFYERSKRYVSPEVAASLRRMISPTIKTVGVFVDADVRFIAELARDGTIDTAQLHGSEDDEYIKALRAEAQIPIIKAFKVRGDGDIASASRSAADIVMLDGGAGDGRKFDWGVLASFASRPFFLAGGLSPDNVREALELTRAWGVDVSSGVETAGLKDRAKILKFVRAVRFIDGGSAPIISG